MQAVGSAVCQSSGADTTRGGMNSDHIDADTLERYALGHLAEPQRALVEEHLLICVDCRMRLMALRDTLGRPLE